MTIALSIDLSFFLSKVLATIAQWQTSWTALYLAWYIVLRGTDFLAELLPLACFFGVLWAEIVHTSSQERMVVWLSGRSPRQCLIPVLLFGAIVGSAQLALNIYLRPLAVKAMSESHLGSYGERFDPSPLSHSQWFAFGHDIVQALVVSGKSPTLRDVNIYRMDDKLSLQTFFRAKLAQPSGDHSWTLVDGYHGPRRSARTQRAG